MGAVHISVIQCPFFLLAVTANNRSRIGQSVAKRKKSKDFYLSFWENLANFADR